MQMTQIILNAVSTLDLPAGDRDRLARGAPLFGADGVLDSHGFLTLCVAVEEGLLAIGHDIDSLGHMTEDALDRLRTVDDFADFFGGMIVEAA